MVRGNKNTARVTMRTRGSELREIADDQLMLVMNEDCHRGGMNRGCRHKTKHDSLEDIDGRGPTSTGLELDD